MRIARMAFTRSALLSQNGITLPLLKQMLNLMPPDTALVGCGFDQCSCLDYIFFTSSTFIDVDRGDTVPNIFPQFVRNSDETTSCTHIDFCNAMDSKVSCLHLWSTHVGLVETYEYCKVCNVRK